MPKTVPPFIDATDRAWCFGVSGFLNNQVLHVDSYGLGVPVINRASSDTVWFDYCEFLHYKPNNGNPLNPNMLIANPDTHTYVYIYMYLYIYMFGAHKRKHKHQHDNIPNYELTSHCCNCEHCHTGLELALAQVMLIFLCCQGASLCMCFWILGQKCASQLYSDCNEHAIACCMVVRNSFVQCPACATLRAWCYDSWACCKVTLSCLQEASMHYGMLWALSFQSFSI